MRRLQSYLDPFAGFKSIACDVDALDFNRRHRRLLLAYVNRWAMIALVCALGMETLAALARAEPVFYVPAVGLAIGFSASICMALLAGAVYFVLGLQD